jgi:hypothetical protein
MSSFIDPLIVEPNDDESQWTLHAPFRYWLDGLHKGDVITIPAGFQTDFASIPRALWSILPPTGRYGKAAVLHDFLYQNLGLVRINPTVEAEAIVKRFTRAECDGIFRDAMLVLGVSSFTAYAMWVAVRAFGWHAWNAHEAETDYPPIFKPEGKA